MSDKKDNPRFEKRGKIDFDLYGTAQADAKRNMIKNEKGSFLGKAARNKLRLAREADARLAKAKTARDRKPNG